MKRICILSTFFATMLFNSENLISQSLIWLNPGIKLGYTFGHNGGFTNGFEVSLTSGDNYLYGIVMDVDFCNGRRKIHLGVEASQLVGLCVGPTWISENGETDVGLSVIPFGGFLLYPYYGYTFRKEKPDIHEIGGYLKLPLVVRGKLRIP